MTRLAPRILALLLCSTALAACAAPTLNDKLGVAPDKQDAAKDPPDAVATDIEGSVRQAQLLRLAGNYDQAVHILSQLMLVASDDPRVVGEYGKALVGQGRASEASQFLNRAIELSPNDWSFYSALGVTYDELGDQVNARAAYEHALALNPTEASVLNNYALSRMLANDPSGAQTLMARAAAAGGAGDAKIARNIDMVDALVPPKPAMVAATPQPAPVTQDTASAPASETQHEAIANSVALIKNQLLPLPTSAPRALQPAHEFVPSPPRVAAKPVVPGGVVMQAVPVDPLAGPVRPRRIAAGKPMIAKALPVAAAKAQKPVATTIAKALPAAAAKAEKPVATTIAKTDVVTAKHTPVKTAQEKDAVPSLRLAADKY